MGAAGGRPKHCASCRQEPHREALREIPSTPGTITSDQVGRLPGLRFPAIAAAPAASQRHLLGKSLNNKPGSQQATNQPTINERTRNRTDQATSLATCHPVYVHTYHSPPTYLPRCLTTRLHTPSSWAQPHRAIWALHMTPLRQKTLNSLELETHGKPRRQQTVGRRKGQAIIG